jgi:hypothetical protein
MIALLLATALSGQPAMEMPTIVLRGGVPALARLKPAVVPPPGEAEPMPNAFRQPAYCPSVVEKEVHRQHVALSGRETGLQYAVFRQLDGCMVPAPAGYHPNYLLPGAADAPAKPEGAPPNRR